MERQTFKKILAVSQNILNECIRHKILNILFVFTIALIGSSLVIQELSPGAEKRTFIDTGYASIEIFGFLTVMFGLFIITFEEFEMKEIWLTLTKPISRTSYILGKFLGISFTLLLNISIMFILLLLLSLINGIALNLNYLIVIVCIFLSLLITIAFTLLLSVVATNLTTGIVFSTFIFIIGHLTQHLQAVINKDTTPPLLKIILLVIYYSTPNLTLFNLKDNIHMIETYFPLTYILKIFIYAIIYITTCLMISSLSFSKKEL